MSNLAFSTLPLPKSMLNNLDQLGFSEMTLIQQQSLPQILLGNDLIAKAKTGSGKTVAFGLGLLNKLQVEKYAVQSLVLCPTRELATQVANELRKLARFRHNIKILTLCGGQPIGPQIGSLEHGAHIIVGTPGRVKDHLRKQTLKLDQVDTLVLDEADRMLDMGFADDIRQITSHTPKQRQSLLFSATYPDSIESLSRDLLTDAIRVEVEATHDKQQIEQFFYCVEREQKTNALLTLLSHYQPESAVIFCNMKQSCVELQNALREQGYYAKAIHGDLEQRDRDQVLLQFANRSCSILIATDVAARGLDIDDLPCVINFDLTRDAEVHTHRIGRTGRAGKSGYVLNLFQPSEAYKVTAIEDYLQQQFTENELPVGNADYQPPRPQMVTLAIAGGKKNKVRAGDILGALTGERGIAGNKVGKISIFDFNAYVAVERSVARKALDHLSKGKIKGRKFKIRRL